MIRFGLVCVGSLRPASRSCLLNLEGRSLDPCFSRFSLDFPRTPVRSYLPSEPRSLRVHMLNASRLNWEVTDMIANNPCHHSLSCTCCVHIRLLYLLLFYLLDSRYIPNLQRCISTCACNSLPAIDECNAIDTILVCIWCLCPLSR